MTDISVHLKEAGISTSADTIRAFERFVDVVKLLRRACPWDREQTHESVRHLLIEEAYETVDAIESGRMDELQKELGDVLLHVVFHAAIAEQAGTFQLAEVIEQETEKLVRRHPHVFGDVDVEDTGQVLRNWERIKIASGEKKAILEGVPRHLPALLRAHRVQEKAAGVGFDFPDARQAWGKVEEELGEFLTASESGDDDAREAELGDVLFALVNYARLTGLNAENALRRTNDKFARRFAAIESALDAEGKQMGQASLEEMDAIWESIKRTE